MVALLASWPGAHAAAQERVDQVDLPRSVADQVIDFFNDPSTIRFTGRVDIPAGRVVMGDVAVLGGPVTIAGEIQGDLVVVNGNLTWRTPGWSRATSPSLGARPTPSRARSGANSPSTTRTSRTDRPASGSRTTNTAGIGGDETGISRTSPCGSSRATTGWKGFL